MDEEYAGAVFLHGFGRHDPKPLPHAIGNHARREHIKHWGKDARDVHKPVRIGEIGNHTPRLSMQDSAAIERPCRSLFDGMLAGLGAQKSPAPEGTGLSDLVLVLSLVARHHA